MVLRRSETGHFAGRHEGHLTAVGELDVEDLVQQHSTPARSGSERIRKDDRKVRAASQWMHAHHGHCHWLY